MKTHVLGTGVIDAFPGMNSGYALHLAVRRDSANLIINKLPDSVAIQILGIDHVQCALVKANQTTPSDVPIQVEICSKET
jgi:hypothetical protein